MLTTMKLMSDQRTYRVALVEPLIAEVWTHAEELSPHNARMHASFFGWTVVGPLICVSRIPIIVETQTFMRALPE